ncbi:hypothetical protein D3C77_331170 [compost metagenome]
MMPRVTGIGDISQDRRMRLNFIESSSVCGAAKSPVVAVFGQLSVGAIRQYRGASPLLP